MKTQVCLGVVAVMLVGCQIARSDTFGTGTNQFTMNFVGVNNPNNVPDSTGYGAVNYSYRIGQYEVTIDQFSKFRLNTGIGSGNEGYWSSVGTDAPAVNVTWNEAAAFCNWLTSGDTTLGAYQFDSGNNVTNINRGAAYSTVYVIPTLDEWYKAAYYTGSGFSDYANGSSSISYPDANFGGNQANPWIVGNDGSGTQEQNGTFDMMGNVFEWTETGDGGGNRYGLGGGYGVSFGTEYMISDPLILTAAGQSYNNDGLGFRVAAIPEPGTISLMSLSTISLFFTRTLRRRKRLGRTLLPIHRESFADAFCTEEEWLLQQSATDEGDDLLTTLVLAAKAEGLTLWSVIFKRYKAVDKVFWNWMVERYERKQALKIARRKAMKKKALDSFDAFLARIMK